MTITGHSFPDDIWDGLTDNPDREDRVAEQWCNHQDWDRIVSEVISVQEVLASGVIKVEKINFGAATVIPVSSDTVSVVRSLHFLNNTNGGTQNVDNLLGGQVGDLLILFGDGVRLRNKGNISLPNSHTLSTGKSIILLFVGPNWFQLSRT